MNTNKNKLRKTKKKGGHKVYYDYNEEIKKKTITPLSLPESLTSRPREDCLACAFRSLGMLSEELAHILQEGRPQGVSQRVVLNMVNDTYGRGHTFQLYPDEKSIKEYLNPKEATLGYYKNNTDTFYGHFFIVLHAENGELYAIDSQEDTVSILSNYLNTQQWENLKLLTEPAHPTISRDALIDALEEEDAYLQMLEQDDRSLTPDSPRRHFFDFP